MEINRWGSFVVCGAQLFLFFSEERGLHSARTSWTLCFGDSCRQELLFLRCSVFLEKVVKCRSRTAAQQNSELVLVVYLY